MAKGYLSPTAINTYLRCPRKYFLKYIKRLKDKPNIYLYRGMAVHKAIARFHKLDLRAFKSHEDMQTSILGIFRENWERMAPQIESLGLPKDQVDRFFLESQDMLRDWVVRYTGSPICGLEGPQTEVKLFSKTHGVMGIVDAIHGYDDKVSLVDYKTSARDDITSDIKVQMAIYALLYEDNHLVRPEVVAIDFLKTGCERRFKVTENLIKYGRDLCRDIHRRTSSSEEGDYPCQCGGWCDKDFATQNGGH